MKRFPLIFALALLSLGPPAWALTWRGVVNQMYLDVLGRRPTETEETTALAYMNEGHSAHDPAMGILTGNEYRTPLVRSYYQKYLNRAPNDAELNQGLTQLQGGVIDSIIIAGIISTAEYFSSRALSSNDTFITVVFNDLFGRNPTVDEKDEWTTFLGSPGMTRAQMAQTLATSSAFYKRQLNIYCLRFLRRASTSYDESQFIDPWHSRLTTDEGVMADLIASEGYSLLPGGSVDGYVAVDTLGDGANLPAKPKLKDISVYIDENRNGTREDYELQSITDDQGHYAFMNVDAGVVYVAVEAPSGWVVPNAPAQVPMTYQSTTSGLYFGAFKLAAVGGIVFNDLDKSGSQDNGEGGLENWTVFLDRNQDGVPDTWELQAVTDKQGVFAFNNVGPGAQALSVVRKLGYHFTGTQPLTIRPSSGSTLNDCNFGVIQENAAQDWALYE